MISLALAALALTPAASSAAQSAPPEAAAPTPAERDIRFASADGRATLAGTLTLPAGRGPFPAAVLLSVAGPDDRDQTLGPHRGYRALAHRLAAQGIASLRFDDRGVGGSTGDYFSLS